MLDSLRVGDNFSESSATGQRSDVQLMNPMSSCPLCQDLQLWHWVHELNITPLYVVLDSLRLGGDFSDSSATVQRSDVQLMNPMTKLEILAERTTLVIGFMS